MSETTLKPCPFCGAKAYAVHRAWAFAEHWEIQTECAEDCINYGIEPEFNTEEEAAERWNRRAERTCSIVHLVDEFGDVAEVCSECGFGNMRDRFTAQPFRFCPNCGARVVEG